MNFFAGLAGVALIVGDHADRRSRLMKIRQKLHDSFTVCGIEIARRFIRQKNRRFAG